MAKREVKPAFSEKMRGTEKGGWSAKGAKVKAAMAPPKEERSKKNRGKVKRAMGR